MNVPTCVEVEATGLYATAPAAEQTVTNPRTGRSKSVPSAYIDPLFGLDTQPRPEDALGLKPEDFDEFADNGNLHPPAQNGNRADHDDNESAITLPRAARGLFAYMVLCEAIEASDTPYIVKFRTARDLFGVQTSPPNLDPAAADDPANAENRVKARNEGGESPQIVTRIGVDELAQLQPLLQHIFAAGQASLKGLGVEWHPPNISDKNRVNKKIPHQLTIPVSREIMTVNVDGQTVSFSDLAFTAACMRTALCRKATLDRRANGASAAAAASKS